MRTFPIAVVCIIGTGCGGSPSQPTPTPDSASAYLDGVLVTMQLNSVNRLKINWPQFRADVLAAAPEVRFITDTFPAIRVALGLLDDHHSFYRAANGSAILNPTSPTDCGVTAVGVGNVPSDIGYVQVPAAFLGTNGDQFTAQIQQRIRDQDHDAILGWIVDVRGNGGGTFWPMLAGVGPILGTGVAGAFVGPVGAPVVWGYDSRGAYLGPTLMQSATNSYVPRRPSPRVAVLTDKGVASAGEAVVVAFRGRADTRSFGTDTCGLPTANTPFTMSDGATLALTTALDADRTSQTYNGPIQPDETITDPASVLQRAIEWIRGG